ncbi:hypothetical protein LCGC14_2558940 [marine sediment metagenome]|uniref:Uncharacterized protein n=1 Tax=marine sediment metagenome TaxID=412755 RepID=A0A0F9CWT9_9ZZZZ
MDRPDKKVILVGRPDELRTFLEKGNIGKALQKDVERIAAVLTGPILPAGPNRAERRAARRRR